jgi:hypothetical protein
MNPMSHVFKSIFPALAMAPPAWRMQGIDIGYQRYRQEEHIVDEKNGWIYWLGFFASHSRLQLHDSDGNTAADCCNRFQKRCWEMGGVLIQDHPMTQNYDRVTLVIDDTGAYENAVVRTRTTASGTSVSYSVIGVFAEKEN